MRYRDLPTVEVTQRVRCDVRTAWDLVTDIGLPARCSSELEAVEWLDGAEAVAVGARFRGRNKHEAFGDWATVCEVVEVEDERRWVYNVIGPEGVSATWAFEKTAEGWNPKTTVPVSDTDNEKLMTVLEKIDAHDDVENVYTNAE